jgi:hypothetical protein
MGSLSWPGGGLSTNKGKPNPAAPFSYKIVRSLDSPSKLQKTDK